MDTLPRRWICIALAYFVVAVALGCFMGGSKQFNLAPVHAHLNLLGWVSMTLTGLIYHHFPAAANNRLAQIHFWSYNLSVPAAMICLALYMTGNTGVDPLLGALSGITFLSILLFAINIWRNSCPKTA